MKKIFSLIFVLLFAQQGLCDLTTADMKKIAGSCSNKKGDTLKVKISFEERNSEQPSLFGPEVRNFEMDLQLKESQADGLDWFTLTERHFDEQRDGAYFFSKENSDCDNPGCANYWLKVALIPKKTGGYWVKANIEFSADVDEEFYIHFGDVDREFLSEFEVDQFCKELFDAENATGYDYYCDYSIDIFMSQDKK